MNSDSLSLTLHRVRTLCRRPLFSVLAGLLLAGALALPCQAQDAELLNFFGGAILNSPSGAVFGFGAGVPLSTNFKFLPSVAIGRGGHSWLFTLDGSFSYDFHLPSNPGLVPYVLGGVGISQWHGTYGSPVGGFGVRVRLRQGIWLVPEVRAGTHGLARVTIGISKSF